MLTKLIGFLSLFISGLMLIWSIGNPTFVFLSYIMIFIVFSGGVFLIVGQEKFDMFFTFSKEDLIIISEMKENKNLDAFFLLLYSLTIFIGIVFYFFIIFIL